MDDDMEDQIIYEIVTTHLHLLWKYVSLTSSGLANFILPGPGESFKSKMFQPGPFMLFTFVIIVSSIFLQTKNNWLQKILLTCHNTISLNAVADHSLKSFVSASIGNDNVSHELCEGVVGVYALQGRRGTMEDRFSALQDVDVSGSNKLSFFGVYDGHGGQFVAEYVKQNLFQNTVQKIRQLRAPNKKDEKEDNSYNRRRKSCTPSLSVLPNSKQKRSSTSPATHQSLNHVKEEEDDGPSNGAEDVCKEVEKDEKDGAKRDAKSGCKVEDVKITEGKCSVKIEVKDEEGDAFCIDSLKKEDPYSSIMLRKRHSLASPIEASVKETNSKESESIEENSYIDVNSNVNYSKLLKDQIIDIDKKVIDICKSKTDLSGTTAVVAVLDGELLIIGNVGDSRAVMGDLKGSTIPLSFDHKPNQLKERKRIKDAGGFITFTGVWRVAGILATSRALGDFPLKDPRKLITAEPDVLTFSLKDHKAHFVILATDGLWDVMSNEDAAAFIRTHIHEKDYGARSLALHAYDKGSQDNITVMVLNLSKMSL